MIPTVSRTRVVALAVYTLGVLISIGAAMSFEFLALAFGLVATFVGGVALTMRRVDNDPPY